MSYPPQHPYGRQQQQAYPPAPQWGQPQPAWGPPPPPPVDPRLERGRKVQKFLRIVFLIALVAGLGWAGIYYGFMWNGAPEKGDCLSTLTEEFDGWQYVECDDPAAAYQIVELVKGPKHDSDLESCEGYPTGTQISIGGGRKSSTRTEFCAVPVGDVG